MNEQIFNSYPLKGENHDFNENLSKVYSIEPIGGGREYAWSKLSLGDSANIYPRAPL